MADRLSVKIRALHDWFSTYATSGVTMESAGVAMTMEILDGFRSDAMALERDGVESKTEGLESRTVAQEARLRARQLRELGDCLGKARTKEMTGALLEVIQQLASDFACALEQFAGGGVSQSRFSDAALARRADAIAEGLRSGKVARLRRPLRPKPAFSDGHEGAPDGGAS